MDPAPAASAHAAASGAAPSSSSSPSKPKRVVVVHHKTMVRTTRTAEMRAEKAAAAAAAAASAAAAGASRSSSGSGSSTPATSAPTTARTALAHLPPSISLSSTLPVPPAKSAAAAAPSDAPPLSQTASSAALKSRGVGVKKAILKPRYATMKPSVSAALTAAAAAASSSAASPAVVLTHATSGKLAAAATLTNRLSAPTASSAAKHATGMHVTPGAHAETTKTQTTLEPPPPPSSSSVVLSDANPSPTALGPSSSSASTATAEKNAVAVHPVTLTPATSSPQLRPSAVAHASAVAGRASTGSSSSTGVPPRHATATSRLSRPPSANAHAASASASSAAASSSSAVAAASSRLSSIDREVLSDIGLIQDWLSSIKAAKRSNLLHFKDTIAQMKKIIFTPQQVTRARKAAAAAGSTTTAATTGTKSKTTSTKKTTAPSKTTLTASQRAAAVAANALLPPLQRKLARLTATPLIAHFDFAAGELAALPAPTAATASAAAADRSTDHSDVEVVSSASALPARASPPLLDGYTRDADDNSDYGDDFDPAAHADGSTGGSGGVDADSDDFDSKLSSFLRKTTKRDEEFIRDSTLSGQGQFAHVSSVVFENGRWIPKSESVMQQGNNGGGGAAASSKSVASSAPPLVSDLDDDAQWGSETDQAHPIDDDDDNALDHIPDFSSSRALDNDADPTSHSPSRSARPGSGLSNAAASRMRFGSHSASTKRASTRGTATLSRTSRATSSAISPAFDDTSDAVSVSVSRSTRSDSPPSQLTSGGGGADATSPPALASSKTFPSSSPASLSASLVARPDDLDDLDAIPDFDSEPPSDADRRKMVAPVPTPPAHSKANSEIVAPFPFAAGKSNSSLTVSSPSHQKSRSIGFIPASAASAAVAQAPLPPTVITVQSWTKDSSAPFVPVASDAAPAPASTLLKKSLAADAFPDDLDGLDDEDEDEETTAAQQSRHPSLLNKPLISTSSNRGGGSKMQTFTSMPVPSGGGSAGGTKPRIAPGHVLTSSASLDDDDALELQLESRAMLSPASTTRSTLRSSGMGGSGLDSEPDSASVNGPSSSSSSSACPVNHSSRISLFSKALVKHSAHVDDEFPSDLDDLSDTEFDDEDRAAPASSATTDASAASSSSLGKAVRELNEFALTPALQATFAANESAHQTALLGHLCAFTSPDAAAAPLHAHVLGLLQRADAITPALRACYVSSDSFAHQFAAPCTALLAEAAAGAKAMSALRRHTYAGSKLAVPGVHQRGRSESGAADAAGGNSAGDRNGDTKAQKQ